MVDFPKKLVLDNVLNKVIAVYDIDSKEMIKNGGSARYSVVSFVQGSVPAGQLAAVQGGAPDTLDLCHQLESATGGTTRRS